MMQRNLAFLALFALFFIYPVFANDITINGCGADGTKTIYWESTYTEPLNIFVGKTACNYKLAIDDNPSDATKKGMSGKSFTIKRISTIPWTQSKDITISCFSNNPANKFLSLKNTLLDYSSKYGSGFTPAVPADATSPALTLRDCNFDGKDAPSLSLGFIYVYYMPAFNVYNVHMKNAWKSWARDVRIQNVNVVNFQRIAPYPEEIQWNANTQIIDGLHVLVKDYNFKAPFLVLLPDASNANILDNNFYLTWGPMTESNPYTQSNLYVELNDATQAAKFLVQNNTFTNLGPYAGIYPKKYGYALMVNDAVQSGESKGSGTIAKNHYLGNFDYIVGFADQYHTTASLFNNINFGDVSKVVISVKGNTVDIGCTGTVFDPSNYGGSLDRNCLNFNCMKVECKSAYAGVTPVCEYSLTEKQQDPPCLKCPSQACPECSSCPLAEQTDCSVCPNNPTCPDCPPCTITQNQCPAADCSDYCMPIIAEQACKAASDCDASSDPEYAQTVCSMQGADKVCKYYKAGCVVDIEECLKDTDCPASTNPTETIICLNKKCITQIQVENQVPCAGCSTPEDCPDLGAEFTTQCTTGSCEYKKNSTGETFDVPNLLEDVSKTCPEFSGSQNQEPKTVINEIQLPFSILLILSVLLVLSRKGKKKSQIA